MVGITDHMMAPPTLEADILGPDVEIDFFDTRMESGLDPERLARR